MGRLSALQVKELRREKGDTWVDAYLAKNPEVDPNTEDTYPEVAPPAGTLPPQNAAAAPAGEEVEDDGGGLSVMDLQRDMLAQEKADADRRLQRFNAATAELAKQRSGPSLSERLFQLSAAFATPTQTPGVSGTLANVMPLLAKQGADVRAGKTLDAEKLRLLREKYEDADAKGEEDTLTRRIELAKLVDAQRKAKEPSVQMDQQGGVHVVPKYAGIAQPKSEEDLAKVPLGAPFIVWEGDHAGQIMYKLVP